jgi:hypothetical protein
MSAQGTLFSNLVMYFITLTTALTLHRHEITDIEASSRLLSTDIDRERKRPRCGAADGSPALVYMSILGWPLNLLRLASPEPRLILLC